MGEIAQQKPALQMNMPILLVINIHFAARQRFDVWQWPRLNGEEHLEPSLAARDEAFPLVVFVRVVNGEHEGLDRSDQDRASIRRHPAS